MAGGTAIRITIPTRAPMNTPSLPITHRPAVRWQAFFRRAILMLGAAAVACLNVACPEKEQTLAQLHAREAQLNQEMDAALKRNDMDAFWRINHEMNDNRAAFERYYGDSSGVQAGMIIARMPEEAMTGSQEANKTAVQNAAQNAAATANASRASQAAAQNTAARSSSGSPASFRPPVHHRPPPPRAPATAVAPAHHP